MDRTFTFDIELRKSDIYSGQQKSLASGAEDEGEADSAVSSQPAEDDSGSSVGLPKATPSWIGSARTEERALHAESCYIDIEVFCDDGPQQMSALLDTGAFQDCISEALWKDLRCSSDMRKLAQAKTFRLGNGTTVMSVKAAKVKWKFKTKRKEYRFLFHVVDDLVCDVILSGPSIFKHEFLSSNPEICVLGLPAHLRPIFENVLSPLGLPTLRRGEILDGTV